MRARGRKERCMPRSGNDAARGAAASLAIATGAAEKGVSQVYETVFRPPEKRYRPWMERCNTQMHAALAELDRLARRAPASGWSAIG